MRGWSLLFVVSYTPISGVYTAWRWWVYTAWPFRLCRLPGNPLPTVSGKPKPLRFRGLPLETAGCRLLQYPSMPSRPSRVHLGFRGEWLAWPFRHHGNPLPVQELLAAPQKPPPLVACLAVKALQPDDAASSEAPSRNERKAGTKRAIGAKRLRPAPLAPSNRQQGRLHSRNAQTPTINTPTIKTPQPNTPQTHTATQKR